MIITATSTAAKPTRHQILLSVTDAPALVGSDRQVAYADDARRKMLAGAIELYILQGRSLDQVNDALTARAAPVLAKASAKDLIEAYEGCDNLTTHGLAGGLNKLLVSLSKR